MPITPFLDGFKFDPESQCVMGVAFEMVRAVLHLANRNDEVADEIIAKTVIELGRSGQSNPDLLCEKVGLIERRAHASQTLVAEVGHGPSRTASTSSRLAHLIEVEDVLNAQSADNIARSGLPSDEPLLPAPGERLFYGLVSIPFTVQLGG